MIVVSRGTWRLYLTALFLAGVGVVISSLLLLRASSIAEQQSAQLRERAVTPSGDELFAAWESYAALAQQREQALRVSVASLQRQVRELQAAQGPALPLPRSGLGSPVPSEAGAPDSLAPFRVAPAQQATTPERRSLSATLVSSGFSARAFPHERPSNRSGRLPLRTPKVTQQPGGGDSKSAYPRSDLGPNRGAGHHA